MIIDMRLETISSEKLLKLNYDMRYMIGLKQYVSAEENAILYIYPVENRLYNYTAFICNNTRPLIQIRFKLLSLTSACPYYSQLPGRHLRNAITFSEQQIELSAAAAAAFVWACTRAIQFIIPAKPINTSNVITPVGHAANVIMTDGVLGLHEYVFALSLLVD